MKPPSTRAKALPIGSGWGFVGTDTTLLPRPSFSSMIVRPLSSRAAQSCTCDQLTVLVPSTVVIFEVHGADNVKSVIGLPSRCATFVKIVLRIGMPVWSVPFAITPPAGVSAASGALADEPAASFIDKLELAAGLFSAADAFAGVAATSLLLHALSKNTADATAKR